MTDVAIVVFSLGGYWLPATTVRLRIKFINQNFVHKFVSIS